MACLPYNSAFLLLMRFNKEIKFSLEVLVETARIKNKKFGQFFRKNVDKQ